MSRFRSIVIAAFLLAAVSVSSAQTPPALPTPVPVSAPEAKPPIEIDPALRATVEAILAERKAAEDIKVADALASAKQHNTVIPLQAVWDNGLWFRTPNKDWNVHFGGRLMFEGVWWSQPQDMKGSVTGVSGVPGPEHRQPDVLGHLRRNQLHPHRRTPRLR
jgi:hypothetical protein